MGKSTLVSIGGTLALAVAILGATANIAYWLYVRKGSDGHDESMVQLAASVSELTLQCDHQRQAPTLLSADAAESGPSGAETEALGQGSPACERLASVSVQLETVSSERDRTRERAWKIVRYLLVWPIVGVAGLFALLRSSPD